MLTKVGNFDCGFSHISDLSEIQVGYRMPTGFYSGCPIMPEIMHGGAPEDFLNLHQ
jgi:hypothetical protein